MIDDQDAHVHERAEFVRNLGPILKLGDEDDSVTDIAINGDVVWVYRGQERERLELTSFRFEDGEPMALWRVMGAARNAAVHAGVPFGPDDPMMSVKVPPHYRVTATMPRAGSKLFVTIRFLPRKWIALSSYEGTVMASEQLSEVRRLLHEKRNVVISGGTGSGKTTMLRAMLGDLPPGERILTIEDIDELNLPSDAAVSYITTEGVGMDALVRQALRSRPDRIVLGEVRGGEALELITAMNTGHAGTLCTIHSNGARAALLKLHNLARRAAPNMLMEEIESAVDAVLQIGFREGRRVLESIWRVSKPYGG